MFSSEKRINIQNPESLNNSTLLSRLFLTIKVASISLKLYGPGSNNKAVKILLFIHSEVCFIFKGCNFARAHYCWHGKAGWSSLIQ